MLVAIVFAAFAGLAWIAIPAYFRARYNTNEVVSTILANYVAVLITSYLTINVFKRPGGLLGDAADPAVGLSAGALLASRGSIGGWSSASCSPSATHFFFHRTSRGYAISEMGANPKFAEYGGIDIKRQGFLVLLASGAVGGLAGGIEALGVHHRFMEGFAPGFGFDGVIAALLANGSPIGTIATALFFGALRSGSLLLEVDTTASREIITVIQALIILAVSAQITDPAQRGGQHGGGAAMEVLERLFNVSLIVATLRTTDADPAGRARRLVHDQGRHLQHRPRRPDAGRRLLRRHRHDLLRLALDRRALRRARRTRASPMSSRCSSSTFRANEVVVGLALNILAERHDDLAAEGDLRHARLDLRPWPSRAADRPAACSRASSAGSAR